MSKAKNFRKRGGGENVETEDEPVEVPSASKASGGNVKSKPKNHKQQQLLSFADEEEDGTAPIRSNKTTAKGKPPRKSSLLSFGGDDDGGDSPQKQDRKGKKKGGYGTSHGFSHKMGADREKTQAVSNILPQAGEYTPQRLQELQKNAVTYRPQPAPVEEKSEELVVVLKGVIKPVSSGEVDEQRIDTSLPGEVVSEPMEIDDYGYSIDGGIPDAAAIAAAKAQRERKRIAQTAPDYISLSTDHGDYRSRDAIEDKGKKDDSSDDEAEVRGRLSFIGSKTNGNAGVFEFVENVEEEDEEKIWEEEQLKKGVGNRDPSVLVGVPAVALPSVLPGFEDSLSVDQEAESVMAMLQQGLKRLQETHAKTKSDLYSIEQSMTASDESIKVLEKNLTTAGSKYVYMQQLRDYISSLCDFLKEKGPWIEQLEEHLLKLHEDRASALFQRRIMDRSDEKVEIEAAVGAAMAVLGRGGSLQMASSQAEAAISALSPTEMAPQLDEFGRDVNLQKRTEKKLRAEARKRRMAKRSSFKAGAEYSSDESDSEERAFQSGWDDAIETADKVFSDATEEFSQLELVKNRLEAWNQQYPGTYRDAYVSLSAPTIFAPFVRLELLKWDPLRDSSGFRSMKWYSQLTDFEDSDLLPSLIERIALPVLHHKLERCWDRLSTRGTVNAVAAVLEMLSHLPASSKPLQELIALVRSHLAGAVSDMEVPSWSVQVLSAVPQAAEVSAYRFNTSVRLLRNIGMWKDVLPKSVIDQLGLDELLNAKILPHLRLLSPPDAIARSSRVVSALRGTWIRSDVKDMSPKLGGFIQFVVGLGKALEKKRDVADLAALAQKLRQTLIDLNESERATEVARVFQLKEL